MQVLKYCGRISLKRYDYIYKVWQQHSKNNGKDIFMYLWWLTVKYNVREDWFKRFLRWWETVYLHCWSAVCTICVFFISMLATMLLLASGGYIRFSAPVQPGLPKSTGRRTHGVVFASTYYAYNMSSNPLPILPNLMPFKSHFLCFILLSNLF